ncbi:MAG: hypothetical protein PHE60_07100 [Sulfurospirillaceae bacterium]|nr:hypothetical protein [Sulfurospirillaceae bacterium]
MHINTAKKKVCPFMVDYTFEANCCQATCNKMCIADECMGWEFKMEDGKWIGYRDVGLDRLPVYEQVVSKTDGYCKRLN